MNRVNRLQERFAIIINALLYVIVCGALRMAPALKPCGIGIDEIANECNNSFWLSSFAHRPAATTMRAGFRQFYSAFSCLRNGWSAAVGPSEPLASPIVPLPFRREIAYIAIKQKFIDSLSTCLLRLRATEDPLSWIRCLRIFTMEEAIKFHGKPVDYVALCIRSISLRSCSTEWRIPIKARRYFTSSEQNARHAVYNI